MDPLKKLLQMLPELYRHKYVKKGEHIASLYVNNLLMTSPSAITVRQKGHKIMEANPGKHAWMATSRDEQNLRKPCKKNKLLKKLGTRQLNPEEGVLFPTRKRF